MSRKNRDLLLEYMNMKRGEKSIYDYAKMIDLLTYLVSIESRNEEYLDTESFDKEIYNILSDLFPFDQYADHDPSYFEQYLEVIISLDKYQEMIRNDKTEFRNLQYFEFINNSFWRDPYNDVSKGVVDILEEMKDRIKNDVYNGQSEYKKLESMLNQYESKVKETALPSSFTPSIYMDDQWIEISKIYKIYEGGKYLDIKLFMLEAMVNGKKEILFAATDGYEEMLDEYNTTYNTHESYGGYDEEYQDILLSEFMNNYSIYRDDLNVFLAIEELEPSITCEELKIDALRHPSGHHSFDEFFQRKIDLESGVITVRLAKILGLEEDFYIEIYKIEDVMGGDYENFPKSFLNRDVIYDKSNDELNDKLSFKRFY